MTQNKSLTKAELAKAADRLLSLHGFYYDGRPKKFLQKKQRYFERKTIITTPMGNGMR